MSFHSMNVRIYDGRVFWKAFSTCIGIIFWVSCHLNWKKKKSSHLIQNCLLFFMLKIKKSETLGKFWDDKCVWEYEYCQAPDVAALMFWTPGEDQDAHQEPDYDLWCIFYTWILIWNSAINIILWRRLFPMSWDIVVRFEGGFCNLKSIILP